MRDYITIIIILHPAMPHDCIEAMKYIICESAFLTKDWQLTRKSLNKLSVTKVANNYLVPLQIKGITR